MILASPRDSSGTAPACAQQRPGCANLATDGLGSPRHRLGTPSRAAASIAPTKRSSSGSVV
jgi:hypothetical protein